MTAAIMLTLILNGQQPFIAHPITADTAAGGWQQIAVPVRDVFEAAGFTVRYREWGDRTVDISGYEGEADERRLVQYGTLYLDRPEARCQEYLATLPSALESIDGALYAPAIVLRIIGGGDLVADLDAGTLRWDLQQGAPPALAMGELMADLPRWLHCRVHVEGTATGPGGEPRRPATSIGPPAPGAWAVADETGAIFCTDVYVAGGLFRAQDLGFEPGQRVAVEGVVRTGWGGLPYLSQAKATPL
ncbi:MAG TPA: hypothetical protein DEP45_10935 [Armatimonadetes bacterium]|nr:hypothetical protein [Armatimonadota bacterium]